MTRIPVTAEQAVRVLEILGDWTRRGWWYEGAFRPLLHPTLPFVVYYTNPHHLDSDATNECLSSRGIDHYDALCQATTVMRMMLEMHPEKI